MNPKNFLAIMGLALSLVALPGSSAPGDQPPSRSSASEEFSADDFDWRETIPYLYIAAGMPAEQGIKALLENSKLLRAYIASDVQAECASGAKPCATQSLQGEVSKRIDEIVQETTSRRRHITLVDYPLTRQHFPFTDITALRTDKHPDAYLVVDFAENSCTAAQLQDKYGSPYDTDVVDWYGVYKYRLDTKNYTTRAAFEIDPVNGSVLRVAISLKRKDGHK
jgi:hypothetical protein